MWRLGKPYLALALPRWRTERLALAYAVKPRGPCSDPYATAAPVESAMRHVPQTRIRGRTDKAQTPQRSSKPDMGRTEPGANAGAVPGSVSLRRGLRPLAAGIGCTGTADSLALPRFPHVRAIGRGHPVSRTVSAMRGDRAAHDIGWTGGGCLLAGFRMVQQWRCASRKAGGLDEAVIDGAAGWLGADWQP